MEELDDGAWADRYEDDTLPVEVLYAENAGKDGQGDVGEEWGPAEQKRDQERALLGDQCPICLHELLDPVMLQGCFHVYCHACLASWVRNLVLHGVHRPTCPLCKRVFHAAYADVVSETEYRVVHFDGSASHGERTRMDGLLRRSMVYRNRMRLTHVNGVGTTDSTLEEAAPKPVKRAKHEHGKWVERELRACVGPDVDLTVFVALIEGVVGATVKTNVDWRLLTQTLEPFLLDDTHIFVRELAFFMGSRLNMQAYDDAVQYCCSEETSPQCSIGACSGSHSI